MSSSNNYSTSLFCVLADPHETRRVDTFLTTLFPEKSRSYIQKIIEEGKVFCNNKNFTKNLLKILQKKKKKTMYNGFIIINFNFMEAENTNINTTVQNKNAQELNFDFDDIPDDEKKFLQVVFYPFFVLQIISIISSIKLMFNVSFLIFAISSIMMALVTKAYFNKNFTLMTKKIIAWQVNAFVTWIVSVIIIFSVLFFVALGWGWMYVLFFVFKFFENAVGPVSVLLLFLHDFGYWSWRAAKWKPTKYWISKSFLKPDKE